MKGVTTFVLILSFACALLAQAPANDHVENFINLGKAPVSMTAVYNNVNAAGSDIEPGAQPVCSQRESNLRDVWFAFISPADLPDLRIKINAAPGGKGIKNPQLALYRFEGNMGALRLSACSETGSPEVAYLDAKNLAPQTMYLVRVWDYAPAETPQWGYFLIGVEQMPGATPSERFALTAPALDTVPVVVRPKEMQTAKEATPPTDNGRFTAKGETSEQTAYVGISIGGSLSGRSLRFKPSVKGPADASGIIAVNVCVNAEGAVTKAQSTLRGSTTANSDLRGIAERAAREFKFSEQNTLEECGTIRFNFQ